MGDKRYRLRPELIESLYYLSRVECNEELENIALEILKNIRELQTRVQVLINLVRV